MPWVLVLLAAAAGAYLFMGGRSEVKGPSGYTWKVERVADMAWANAPKEGKFPAWRVYSSAKQLGLSGPDVFVLCFIAYRDGRNIALGYNAGLPYAITRAAGNDFKAGD